LGRSAHHLERGRPLIVSLKASGPHGPLHYVVVVGIDSAKGTIYVNDPAQQRCCGISREGFESEWSATEHWTLLAVRETPIDFLSAAVPTPRACAGADQ